jgi:hypothetical protein
MTDKPTDEKPADTKPAGKRQRRSIADRARKRAIRAHAAQAGVPYSVAARHLDDSVPIEPPASRGRTAYPTGSDEHRRWSLAARERRPYDQRVRDTREAVRLPLGRAGHLVARFPSMRGEPGTGIGRLYHGEARLAVIAMLYAAVAHEQPSLIPPASELAWIAELGEEAAVDGACAGVDRAARDFLEQDRWSMWSRVEAALTAQDTSPDREAQRTAALLRAELASLSLLTSVDGARHTLDALLVATNAGHAPGTRVRILVRPHRGRTGTIVGARWAASGPPLAYEVCPDTVSGSVTVAPRHLTVLTDATDRVPTRR